MSLKEFREYILPQLKAAKELGIDCHALDKAIMEEYYKKRKENAK